jgi:hypothetical protein
MYRGIHCGRDLKFEIITRYNWHAYNVGPLIKYNQMLLKTCLCVRSDSTTERQKHIQNGNKCIISKIVPCRISRRFTSHCYTDTILSYEAPNPRCPGWNSQWRWNMQHAYTCAKNALINDGLLVWHGLCMWLHTCTNIEYLRIKLYHLGQM